MDLEYGRGTAIRYRGGPTYDTIDIMMQPEERETARQAQSSGSAAESRVSHRRDGIIGCDIRQSGRRRARQVRIYTRVRRQAHTGGAGPAMKAGRTFVTSGPLLLLDIGRTSDRAR